MYNTDIPNRAELPSTRQLLRSTIIAVVAAAVILITVVLPAEYGVDPTGAGRAMGITEMGQIKTQLAEEAERDRAAGQSGDAPVAAPAPDRRSGLLERVFAPFLIGSAAAQTAPAARSDEVTLTLKPGVGTEVKLVMKQGAKVTYSWTVAGGAVNFDLHGDGGGKSISYEKGRGAPSAEGVLQAAFTGNHGWYWRNRGTANVTVTLRVNGDYTAVKRDP